MPELPIACTLSPDGLSAHMALIDALSADGLLDRTGTETGLRVRLRAMLAHWTTTRRWKAAGAP